MTDRCMISYIEVGVLFSQSIDHAQCDQDLRTWQFPARHADHRATVLLTQANDTDAVSSSEGIGLSSLTEAGNSAVVNISLTNIVPDGDAAGGLQPNVQFEQSATSFTHELVPRNRRIEGEAMVQHGPYAWQAQSTNVLPMISVGDSGKGGSSEDAEGQPKEDEDEAISSHCTYSCVTRGVCF